MNKLKSFIRRLPSYVLVTAGIIFFIITYLSPRYIGLIPGVIAVATWVIILGRAVRKSLEKHPKIKQPWWTNW